MAQAVRLGNEWKTWMEEKKKIQVLISRTSTHMYECKKKKIQVLIFFNTKLNHKYITYTIINF